MSASVENWVNGTWPAGTLVAGGYDADGKMTARRITESDAAYVSADAWSALNEAVTQLDAYGCGTGRTFWIFETAVFSVVYRKDGVWAGVFAARELSEAAKAAINTRLNEFGGAA
jgi:hypothetical protein